MAQKKISRGRQKAFQGGNENAATAEATTEATENKVYQGSSNSEVHESGAPSMADNLITAKETSIMTNRCYLLEMTSEIRQKILAYAVKHDSIVRPTQVKHRSNKFWPSRPKIAAGFTKTSDDDHLPSISITAFPLSLTCHQLYDEVAGTGLFYHLNKFNFACFNDMLAYLVAITPIRRNAIRAVSIDWNHDRWTAKHAFTMLATCEGLRKLEVDVHYDSRWMYGLYGDGFLDELASKITGLEEFKFVGLDDPPTKYDTASALMMGITRTEDFIQKDKARLAARSRKIQTAVTQTRRAVPLGKIRAAEEASRLNIFGEGRLGPDKKPSIIASRTRGQLRKEKSLDEFGVLQEAKEYPKYSKFGDLLWDVKEIDNSREVATDHGKKRIEVHVIWNNKPEQSWEILDRIISTANIIQVGRHYVKNPEAYDIGIAISTIKDFVEKDPVQTFVLESLITMLKKNDSPEAGAKARRLVRSRSFR